MKSNDFSLFSVSIVPWTADLSHENECPDCTQLNSASSPRTRPQFAVNMNEELHDGSYVTVCTPMMIHPTCIPTSEPMGTHITLQMLANDPNTVSYSVVESYDPDLT